MRKITTLAFLAVCLSGFSQEKPPTTQDSIKTITSQVDLRFDLVRLKLNKRLFKNDDYIFVSTFILKLTKISFIEGMRFNLDKHVSFTPGLGVNYNFDGNFNFIAGVEIRMSYPRVFVRINYGYNGYVSSVNTRTMYLFPQAKIAIGIESENQYAGPRGEWLFHVGKKDIRSYASYVNDEVHFGLSFNVLDFLSEKARQKIKKLEYDLNPFKKRL